jgi:hypothetical protein
MDLLQDAFDALRRTTGLEGRLAAVRVPGQDGRRAEAHVEIAAEGKRYGYVAVLKRVDRFATLGIIKHQFERYDEPGLLVAHIVKKLKRIIFAAFTVSPLPAPHLAIRRAIANTHSH